MIGRTLNLGNLANRNASLNRGRMAWWLTLQGGGYYGGTRLLDLMGENHGTLTNGPTWQSAQGRPGGSGSIDGDGTDKFIELPRTVPNFGSGDYTFGCWFLTRDTVARQILFAKDDPAGRQFHCTAPNPNVGGFATFHVDTTEVARTAIAIAVNTWYHLVVSRVGTTTTIYLNGKPDGSGTSVNMVSQDVPFRLGGRSYSGFTDNLNGLYDEFSIFNRGFTDAEVLALYNESRAGSPDTLHWIRRPWLAQTAAAASVGRGLTHSTKLGRLQLCG